MDNNEETVDETYNKNLNITDEPVDIGDVEDALEIDDEKELERAVEDVVKKSLSEPQEVEEAEDVNETEIDNKEDQEEETSDEGLELSLGQVIKIFSPDNNIYHEKNFLINYIDENKINIIDIETEESFILNKENAEFTDETIEEIEIVYEPEEKGYARQNGFITGYNISIEFGGDVPTIINGEITNLEEDMIEITLYNSTTKVYIDFAYKGLPEDLNIISIKEFFPPEEKEKLLESVSLVEKPKEVDEELDDIIYDSDDMDDIEHDYDEQDIQITQQAELLEANGMVVDDKSFMILEEEYTVSEEHRRYNFNKQTEDLLDNMLGKLSTSEKTRQVIEEINKNIVRFKELRYHFSEFEKDGIIQRPKYNYTNDKQLKPLSETLKKLNKNINWIIPVIKQNKKLYDIDLMAVGETKMKILELKITTHI